MQIEALARLRRNQGIVADTRGEVVAVNPFRDCEMSLYIKGLAESPLYKQLQRQMQYLHSCYSMSSFYLIFVSSLLSERRLSSTTIDFTCTDARFLRNLFFLSDEIVSSG